MTNSSSHPSSFSFADIRTEYAGQDLLESEIHLDPIMQFQTWFKEAEIAHVDEPTAMTLSTITEAGLPSARIVLLKGVEPDQTGTFGFTFYTNYESAKGHELARHPFAALTFFWSAIARQVRIEGKVIRVSDIESDAYFATRPRGSQLGAWVSAQSSVIPHRETLDRALRDLEEHYRDKPIPRPAYWGGYRVMPHVIEFWQGKPNRLHDRIRYRRDPAGAWVIERLAP